MTLRWVGTGATGATGATGVGTTGATGATGAGVSTFNTNSSTVGMPGSAVVGSFVTATVSCTTGKMLSGGANITGDGTSGGNMVLIGSYPSSTTVWTAVAQVTVAHGTGSAPSLVVYAFCGQ